MGILFFMPLLQGLVYQKESEWLSNMTIPSDNFHYECHVQETADW